MPNMLIIKAVTIVTSLPAHDKLLCNLIYSERKGNENGFEKLS